MPSIDGCIKRLLDVVPLRSVVTSFSVVIAATENKHTTRVGIGTAPSVKEGQPFSGQPRGCRSYYRYRIIT